jgi:curved DNA-binding protein CbpA
MNLDPYDELGVDRDANAPEIKSAFKRRAKKTHPDKGGSVDAFQRARLALTILTDPGRRARYDATGTIEDDKPDNVRAGALQVIQNHMGGIVNQFMHAADDAAAQATDPRKIDVLGVIDTLIRMEMDNMLGAIRTHEKALEFLRDMRRRFRKKKNPADDPIGRGFDDQVKRAGGEIEKLRDGIAMREKAVEIVAGYAFERDQPQPVGNFVTTGITGNVNGPFGRW